MKKPVKRGRPPLAVKRKVGRPKKIVTPAEDWSARFDERMLRRQALDYAKSFGQLDAETLVHHAEKIYRFLKGGETKAPVRPAAEAELLSVLRDPPPAMERGSVAYASDADADSKRDFYNAETVGERRADSNKTTADRVATPAAGFEHGVPSDGE